MKNDFSSIIMRFFKNPVLAFLSVILIFFAIVGIFIIAFQNSNKTKKLKPQEEEKIVLELPLVPPSPPKILNDYYPFREERDAWGEAEAKKYFTLPDENLLQDLEEKNDSSISEILGSAP